MEQKLKETIQSEMQKCGKTNVKTKNIRLFQTEGKQYAFADVSYTWQLNGHDKDVEHKDMIFALTDSKWESPLFL